MRSLENLSLRINHQRRGEEKFYFPSSVIPESSSSSKSRDGVAGYKTFAAAAGSSSLMKSPQCLSSHVNFADARFVFARGTTLNVRASG